MNAKGLSRIVWGVSLPLIFAEISESILHVTDSIFLARVGVTELGAVAIANTILEIFLVLPLGLVDGIQILIARRAGQRRPEAVAAIFRSGFALVVAVSMVMTAAVKLLYPHIAGWLVSSEPVGIAIGQFVQIGAYGLVFTAASFAYSALFVSLGKTRILIPAAFLLAVTNVVLDYLLIFGHLGLPRLGMRGAAWGAVGAEIVTFLFLTGHAWRHVTWQGFRFRRSDLRVSRLLGGLSIPVVAQGILESVRWFAFFLIVERMSTNALAIASLVYACYAVLRIPTEGFAETVCSMVSRFVGRERAERVAPLVGQAAASALLLTLPFLGLALLFPGMILAVFSPDASLIAESSASLRVIALTMLVVIPGEMWFAAVSGTGDTQAALGIECALTITMLASAYVAGLHFLWTVDWVWISLPVAWLIALGASYGWVRSGLWRRLEI